MPELPHDVWASIAGLLETDHLLTLVSVNRSFYHIVLDARYREIHWVKLDDYMLKTLIRLQDSVISERVRRLHIRAWFIQYLASSNTPKSSSRQHRFKRWTFDRLSTISNTFKPTSSGSSATTSTVPPPWPKPKDRPGLYSPVCVFSLQHRLRHTLSITSDTTAETPSSLIPLMVTAFQQMINLTEYDFEWRDLALNEITRSFLPDNTAVLSTLRKLVLHAQLPQFRDLLSQFMLMLPSLEVLELFFDYTSPSVATVSPSATPQDLTPESAVLTTTIAPFIASLRSSLQSLTISSSINVDHSDLFKSLATDLFPYLHVLAIRIPFDNDHLSETEGLTRILYMHATILSHVELRPSGSGETALGNGGPWSRMSRACLTPTFQTTFSNLESLSIPVLESKITLELVRRSADTLRSLSLTGRLLKEYDVQEVVKVFNNVNGGKLRKLDLCVGSLTPTLFGLLAAGLPALLALCLVVDKNFSRYKFSKMDWQRPPYDWGLCDLSIYLGRNRGSVEAVAVPMADLSENGLMVEMLKFLPSVKTFKQQSGPVQQARSGDTINLGILHHFL